MCNNFKKLAIGTAQFGLNYGIANEAGQLNHDQIKEILNYAYSNSINYLDTARAYGQSEKAIGQYLKSKKKKWFVSTKISSLGDELIQEAKDSGKNLSVIPDSILAHSANIFIDPNFQKNIEHLKQMGVFQVGVSVYTEKEIDAVLKKKIKPDVIQLPINILDSKLYKNGTINRIFDENIEVHARSVFLQGLFFLTDTKLENRFNGVLPSIKKLKAIAARFNITLPQLSLLWLISLKEVRKVVIGVDSLNQLKKNCATIKKQISSSAFKEALEVHFEDENILNPSKWL